MRINFSKRELTIVLKKVAPISSDVQKKPKHIFLLYFLLIFLSLLTWFLYFRNNVTLSYNDARSHLNISRRVVESLQPGLAQLGTVWLPLQHILQLPTIGWDVMYRTGLSGSLISMASFVFSSIFIFYISLELGFSELVAYVVVLAFSSNQNILYLQSTPMTESLLICMFLGIVFYYIKWLRDRKIMNLVLCAAFSFLAGLTRYDGWFIICATSVAVLIAVLWSDSFKKVVSSVYIYTSLAMYSVVTWLVWNKIIFGNWLFFILGPYSAKAQQDILYSRGLLPTKSNLFYSLKTLYYASIFNIGYPLVIIGFIGFLFLMFTKKDKVFKTILIILLSPIIFNLVSLYFGHSVIHLPNIYPYNWFNVRYGVMGLPFFAIASGFVLKKNKYFAVICAAIILANSIFTLYTKDIITVKDGFKGSSGYFLDDVALWIKRNASQGLILVASSSHDALIFSSGLPLTHFITEGMSKYWEVSLKHPALYSKYIVMHDGDTVYRSLSKSIEFSSKFRLVFDGEQSDVYERIEELK